MDKIKYLKAVSLKVLKKAWNDDIFSLASQLAYNLLLSFFPFVIFLLTLVGYSSVNTNDIMLLLKEIIPEDAFELVQNTVLQIVNVKQGGLLSISIFITIWAASSGFNAIIKGINKAYREKEYRSFIKVQLVSILFTLILALIIMMTVLFLVLGEVNGYILAQRLSYSAEFYFLWYIMRFVILIIASIFVFALIYKYAPCKKHSIREVLPGAVFDTAGWLILSLSFSFYINRFTNYSILYGSFGTVIIFMLWLLISSIIVILGGEVNSVLMVYSGNVKKNFKINQ